MSNENMRSLADLPPQRSAHPATIAEGRARYFNSGNAFDIKLPPVPNHVFTDEPSKVFADGAATGLVACDLSEAMESGVPATTPLALARYARINAGEDLKVNFAASGVVVYVIQGSGTVTCVAERVEWGAGDAILLPGGVEHHYHAGDKDSILWLVTNEPMLQFEHLQPPVAGDAPTAVVHYPAAEMERQISLIYEVGKAREVAGFALILSSEQQEERRNVLPTLTAAMNSLPPHAAQRAHRHNSMAITLIVDGDNCYSLVDGVRKDWKQWATTVTPPTSVHSHHNGGDRPARFFIVQDGGLYYHVRAMGFSFAD